MPNGVSTKDTSSDVGPFDRKIGQIDERRILTLHALHLNLFILEGNVAFDGSLVERAVA